MSYAAREHPDINRAPTRNVNSNDFDIEGFWHPMMGASFFANMGGERRDGGEPVKAMKRQRTERYRGTQPGGIRKRSRRSSLSGIKVTGNSLFTGPIFQEPQSTIREPAPEEAGVYGAPVREPPAWKLRYKIGGGAFGAIFLEKVQTRGMELPELWAVKRISKAIPNFPAKRYQAEIRNLQALSKYEWFVKFNTSYEDRHFVYIAMEYIPIGDMEKTFAKGCRWNEKDTRVVVEQLLRGLVAMHKEGITHRDLKPENIFPYPPQSEIPALQIKIGDFGGSKRIPLLSATTYLKTTIGTEGYMAPEMDDTELEKDAKTNRVDIWSLGCIVYRMLAGSLLFNSRREVWKYSMQGSSPPPAVEKSSFSTPCVDFLRSVLEPGPKTRPSAETCLTMSWIASRPPGSPCSIGTDLYNRLSKIEAEARDSYPLLDMALSCAASNSLTCAFDNIFGNTLEIARSLSTGLEALDVDYTPVRNPLNWTFRYKIGIGAFGTIFLEKVWTRGMASPELWAVKQISKAMPNFPAKRYQAEIKNSQILSKYEWFVKFYSSYEDRHYVYIAMEYIPIGDMEKTFAKGCRWNEKDTRVVVEQLLRGLVAMHKEGIIHRDLKPENIFLCLPQSETPTLQIKIGDFGGSGRFPLSGSTCLKTTVGSGCYMAPEMDDTEFVEEPKTNRVDIWSLGCIVYRMLAGSLLFNSRREVWKYSMRGSSPPPAVEKLSLSIPCLDLLRAVLEPGHRARSSAENCLTMFWITSMPSGSPHSIGRDLYTCLFKIEAEAHDIDSFSDAVSN